MELISSLLAALPEWLTALTVLVSAATAVTALTPTQIDNNAVDWLLKILNFLAGNFGKNKNADAS